MNKNKIVFLLFLLQLGQVTQASQDAMRGKLHRAKKIQLVAALQQTEKDLSLVRSNGMTKHFTVRLQNVVEQLEGVRIGGDYATMKESVKKNLSIDEQNLNVDKIVSDEIRSAITEHVIEKYGRREIEGLLQKNGMIKK